MRVVFHLADRVTVLDEGKLLADGTPGRSPPRGGAGRLSRKGGMSSVALEAEASTRITARAISCTASAWRSREGEIVALLGRNGAGKTTTLRSLMGLTPAPRGPVRIFGADATRWPAYRIAARGVGYVPEGRRIFANLSVDENLKVPLERPGPWTIARIYELFPRLAERKISHGRQLSGGEQEMLAIARALLLNPKLLLLTSPRRAWRH